MIYLTLINQKTYTMDTKLAGETLQNVLNACGREPLTVSFDKILLRQKAQTAVYMFGISLSVCLFVLMCTVPCIVL